MKNAIFGLLVFSGTCLRSQTYTPVTVSGFNIDAVAETYPNSLACTTQALDQVVAGGNSVMYNAAFAAAASFGGGLPNTGTIVSGTKTFQLMPYAGNNALFAPAGSTNTLTVATPASFSNISLLVFSTEGSSTINVTLRYTDLTVTNAGNFTVLDWFNGANAVITGIGRCKRVTSGVTADGLPSNPRLYGIDIPLSCANQQKQLASVVVSGISSNPAGGGGYVLAVSGVTTSIASPTVSYANLLCQGASPATPTLTGATGGSYASGPAGLSLNASTGAINLVSSVPATYTVNYTSGGVCPLTASTSVVVTPAPTIAVNTPTVCAGQTASLVATGGNSYAWIGNNLSAVTGASVTANIAATSIYTVTGTLNGCNSTTTTAVTVNPLPVITTNFAVICPGEQAVLTSTVSISGGSYQWLPGNETTSGITVSPTTSFNYTVVYTVNSCSASALAAVNLKAQPAISVNSGSVCEGNTMTLNANASPGGGSFLWQPGGQTSAYITEGPTAPSNYTVSYTLNGCVSSAQTSIGIYPSPDAKVEASTPMVAPGDEVTLTASGGSSYAWSTGATSAQLLMKPSETTNYCVTASSVEGCKRQVCVEVLVKAESALYVPNVFTPNGDGLNDEFHILGYNLSEFDLRIYSRWGQELFHSSDPLKGWDGSVKGQTVSGVYVYIIKSKGNDGTDYRKTGHLTLLQ